MCCATCTRIKFNQADKSPRHACICPPASTLRTTLKNRFKPALLASAARYCGSSSSSGVACVSGGRCGPRSAVAPGGPQQSSSPDLDLVVDGFLPNGSGGGRGRSGRSDFKPVTPRSICRPTAGFQTAAWSGHKDLDHPLAALDGRHCHRRTEFYPYPAANPEVRSQLHPAGPLPSRLLPSMPWPFG